MGVKNGLICRAHSTEVGHNTWPRPGQNESLLRFLYHYGYLLCIFYKFLHIEIYRDEYSSMFSMRITAKRIFGRLAVLSMV